MLIWVSYIIVYNLGFIPNLLVMLIWVSYIIVYNFGFVPNYGDVDMSFVYYCLQFRVYT